MKLSMVHWLIAAALLANGVVFYWQQAREEPVSPVNIGLRELRLLSEVEPGRESTLATEPAQTPADLPPAALPAPEQASVERSAAETAGVESEFDDVSPAVLPADRQTLAVSAPELSAPEPPPRCWLAGPVDNDALSEQLTVAFAAAGVSMDLVLQTTEISPDNWVHLPTSGEQADVRRLSQELRQAGFDNFSINDGPLAGSLSLGLFRSKERAIGLRDTLRGRGYQAAIYQREAFAEQPWISLDETGRIALDWPAVEGQLPGFDALRLLVVECPPQP